MPTGEDDPEGILSGPSILDSADKVVCYVGTHENADLIVRAVNALLMGPFRQFSTANMDAAGRITVADGTKGMERGR